MDPLSISAASGLQSRMDSLELLANNLANAGTSGYKSDREFYGLFASPYADSPMGSGLVSTLPVVERQWTDFSQGTLQPTGNQLDIALAGKGFLQVQGPDGPLYTRNGSLKISPTGELQSSEGYPIRTADNQPIQVTSEKPVEIAKDGTIRQDKQTVGQLQLVDFASTDSLKKQSGAYFQNTDPDNKPTPATDIAVEQGKLEGSNVTVPEAAMRLVGMMRQFEMLQKAITLDSEMNLKAIQEVARVGQ
jgi:flagellar basal-body rod protein FlgF